MNSEKLEGSKIGKETANELKPPVTLDTLLDKAMQEKAGGGSPAAPSRNVDDQER